MDFFQESQEAYSLYLKTTLLENYYFKCMTKISQKFGIIKFWDKKGILGVISSDISFVDVYPRFTKVPFKIVKNILASFL